MVKKAKPAASKPATEKRAKATSGKSAKSVVKPPGVKSPAGTRAATKKAASKPEIRTSENASAAEAFSTRFASFEEAKEATIDTLLAQIESSEARLLAIKRATTFEQLEPLAGGDGESHSAAG